MVVEVVVYDGRRGTNWRVGGGATAAMGPVDSQESPDEEVFYGEFLTTDDGGLREVDEAHDAATRLSM